MLKNLFCCIQRRNIFKIMINVDVMINVDEAKIQ